MLFFISCRGAVRRLATEVPTFSTGGVRRLHGLRRVRSAKLAASPGQLLAQGSSPALWNTIARRAYATEGSKPKPRATTRKSTSKTRSTSTKKPKKPASKSKSKKASTTGRKKKAAPKKPARKTRKPLTDKQEEAAKQKKARDEIRKLKENALTLPKQLPSTVWLVLSEELGKSQHKLAGREAKVKYDSLSSQELEHYNGIASQNKVANAARYKEWLKSFSPDQIRIANNARLLLKRRGAAKTYRPLKDDRLVKGATSSYLQYSIERRRSGDFQGLKISDASKRIGAEWKSMSAAEKEKYQELAQADRLRFNQEYKTVYSHDTPSMRKSSTSTSSRSSV
ncbi:MAG: pre-mRNA processing RNA-helicase [Chaenotheca gracillima]|nr:MAG: pre-mRNA processing RNA-helicase [Chaenotheca gracillima]